MLNNFHIEFEVLKVCASCYDFWQASLLLAPFKYVQQLSKIQLSALKVIQSYNKQISKHMLIWSMYTKMVMRIRNYSYYYYYYYYHYYHYYYHHYYN